MKKASAESRPSVMEQARSFLFVPADRPDRARKALGSQADVVIIDLEDAVAADNRVRAREELPDLLMQDPRGGRTVVRISHPASPDGAEDLLALSRLNMSCGVMVAKADTVETVAEVVSALGHVPIIPLIETARGVANAADLAGCEGVVRLAFGHLDLCSELGIDPSNMVQLSPARYSLVAASALGGLPGPVDGVTVDLGDVDRVARATRESLANGFLGKLCIHPRQIAAIHEGYAPSDTELEWAARVLASHDDGVRAVDGLMVDRPVVLRAQSIQLRNRV